MVCHKVCFTKSYKYSFLKVKLLKSFAEFRTLNYYLCEIVCTCIIWKFCGFLKYIVGILHFPKMCAALDTSLYPRMQCVWLDLISSVTNESLWIRFKKWIRLLHIAHAVAIVYTAFFSILKTVCNIQTFQTVLCYPTLLHI